MSAVSSSGDTPPEGARSEASRSRGAGWSSARGVVLERTNARYVESLPGPVELVAIDVSFISLRIILPAVAQWLGPAADVIALIKPQFEAGPESVGKGGNVRDAAVRRRGLAGGLARRWWAVTATWSIWSGCDRAGNRPTWVG